MPDPRGPSSKIELRVLRSHHTATMRSEVDSSTLSLAMGRVQQAVREALEKQGVTGSSGPFARYHSFGETVDFEAGVMVEYCRLVAPFDGVITRRGVDPGDLVRHAGGEQAAGPLFVVTRTDRVRIRTTVPEAEAPLVDVGDPVTVALSSRALPPVKATVTRTSGNLDPSTRTMTVEIETENRRGKLLPGMYGEATILLHESADAVTLPASAVRFSETGGSFVYVVDRGKVAVVDVELGSDSGQRLEILSPLTAGQKVIDAHLRRFRDGDVVKLLD